MMIKFRTIIKKSNKKKYICIKLFHNIGPPYNCLRAHAIFSDRILSAIEFFLSTWCGRLSWKSFLLPKIKYIELFDR